MKKLSLLFVMLVAMAFGVKAQGHYFIPTIGYNLSSMVTSNCYLGLDNKSYDVNDYIHARLGFNFGLNYRYEFKKPFLIEAGFYYNNYGYRMNDIKEGSVRFMWDYNQRITHLSGQVMFGYKFVIGQSRIFSVTPKIGIQLGGYNNVYYHYTRIAYNENFSLVDQTVDKKLKFSDEYAYNQSGFDFAEIVAVEFGWQFNDILGIFLSLNNRYSFKNMLKNEKDPNGNQMYMFNYGFSANVGLKVKLGD